jgi:cobalt-zinc-cadmium efflux system outer membrane protein
MLPHALQAQEKRILTLGEYLDNVRKYNIGYVAETYHVNIADAELKAAAVFPDPELSVTYANNQDWAIQMGYTLDASLSYTLELGGKRKARIRVAQSEKELASALLEDYFSHLRADATIAFLEAIKDHKLYEIQQASYLQMLALARADSLRLRLGVISETDALQSRLEAAALLNEVHAGEGKRRESLTRLLLFQGSRTIDLPDSVAGSLNGPKHDFDLSVLLSTARQNRADLKAALRAGEVSQNNLRLAGANRALDLGLSIGGGYSSEVRNNIAPAPAFRGITAGVSIPLRFSNANKGALRAAQLAAEQSEKQYEAIEQQIRLEVMQAHNAYVTACRKVEQFDTGLLHEAENILLKKIYRYERGETALLEVLNARRTYNDIRVSYHETLYECASALVELERACGI